MLLALVMGLLFFFSLYQPLPRDPDIGWHLRDAQALVQQHAFVRQDTLTFSLHGHPWVDPEWLSELCFYAVHSLFGLRGIEVLTIALLQVLLLGVCTLAWLHTRALRPALVAAVIFILFLTVSMSPRTQLFGWIAFTLELIVLEQYRAGKDRLWLLPPLFTLWINLHGSWPIGLVLLAIFLLTGLTSFRSGAIEAWAWAPHQRNRLLLFIALVVPALFLNPYGWRLVFYPFEIAGKHTLTLNAVQEWQSLNFHVFRGRAIFCLVAAYFAGRTARARTWTLHEAVVLFLALFAGFTYSRFLLFTGIILCPMIAAELTFLGSDDPAKDKRLLNTAIIAVILFFAVTHIPNENVLTLQQDEGYPAQAVHYLRQHPLKEPLLNDFNWGGYLAWNLPTQPIFIDTRADIFEQSGLFKTYLDMTALALPVEDYNHGQLRYVLFPRSSPLVAALSRSPNWATEYQDDTAVLLHRLR
jgi:hypothetical protein